MDVELASGHVLQRDGVAKAPERFGQFSGPVDEHPPTIVQQESNRRGRLLLRHQDVQIAHGPQSSIVVALQYQRRTLQKHALDSGGAEPI